MANTTISQYQKYWEMLLADGKLTLQLPTHLVPKFKAAIIKRKHDHRQRSGIKFSKLRCDVSAAKDAKGNLLTGKSQLDFTLHNVTTEGI